MTVRLLHSKWRHFENVIKNVMTSPELRALKALFFLTFKKIINSHSNMSSNNLTCNVETEISSS